MGCIPWTSVIWAPVPGRLLYGAGPELAMTPLMWIEEVQRPSQRGCIAGAELYSQLAPGPVDSELEIVFGC